jgi:hypothetical protein
VYMRRALRECSRSEPRFRFPRKAYAQPQVSQVPVQATRSTRQIEQGNRQSEKDSLRR